MYFYFGIQSLLVSYITLQQTFTPSHPAKRHNRFARPDNNNNNNGSRQNASRQRSRSRPNNQQPHSRSRSQHRRPWNRDNLHKNAQRPLAPDINELNYYADGMDVSYPGPVALTDWKSIGASLEKLESFMVASTSPSTPVVMKPAPYVPSSMQGWDDASAVSTNNILVDISSPPLQSTNSLAPIPQFVPIPPSNVVPSSSVDMEQCLLSLSNTVSSLAGSINKGIEQNNLILARQNGQANN
ncbi:hypothetical protein RhiirA4_482820 [Rhizophagus irregularis]|uniref:Uncharacterized protein n=1 Tax=Rhizophagus irregularis TaxID=588596 RepID=A0A2I1HLP8_9GLOM|nr:hypothetical protein RhiirA4_482820 [Rhizophagus irregularis]